MSYTFTHDEHGPTLESLERSIVEAAHDWQDLQDILAGYADDLTSWYRRQGLAIGPDNGGRI
jgi:hypothetical protein